MSKNALFLRQTSKNLRAISGKCFLLY